MTTLLLQLPETLVSIDESEHPDPDDSQILEHLIRHCTKLDNLPAITVSVDGKCASVLRGHKYLVAARRLGRATIRAVVATPFSQEQVQVLLAQAGVAVLDLQAIERAESQDMRPKGWHTFFFERPLSSEEKRAFALDADALFSDPELRIVHDDSGPLAEVEARAPVSDHDWARRHLDTFSRFSQERVPIVSFQGRRFPRHVRPTNVGL